MKAIALALLGIFALTLTPALAEQGTLEEQVVEWMNGADATELQTVKGIGKVKAEAIITARDLSPFKTYKDILAVKGIGPKTLDKIKETVEAIDPD